MAGFPSLRKEPLEKVAEAIVDIQSKVRYSPAEVFWAYLPT